MLKVIHFDGYLVANIDDDRQWTLKGLVREAIDDGGCSLNCQSNKTTKPSEIPHDWLNSIPYGRTDDKTCIQIFEDEIMPAKPVNDPNQNKFGFWEDIEPQIPNK